MIGVTVRQLEYLSSIADSRTLTEAAQRCFVSQAAMSTALAQLEDSLGLSLVIRHKASRQIALTREGQIVAARAREICHQLEELQNVAKLASEQLVGEFRLGCFSPLSPVVLPGLLQHFAEHHPGLKIQTVEGAPNNLEQSLMAGGLDAVLAYSRHLSGDLHLEKLAAAQLFVLLPATHRLANRKSIALPEVADEDLVLLDMAPINTLIPDLLSRHEVPAMPAYRSSNVETVRALVARGLGYSVMAIPPTEYGTGPRSTVAIPISSDYPQGHMVIATRNQAHVTARAEAIAAECRRIFAAHDSLS